MLNTHLDHKGPQARLESVKLIVGKLKEMGGDTLTVFVTGDFNARPEHELFAPLKAYMADTRTNTPETDLTGTTNGFGTEPEGKIIDYIFYRNANPLSYRVITGNYGIPYISDHYPILGTFDY